MSKDIEAFDQLVSHLNYRWKLHKDLFQGPQQYELFNEAGSNVWVALRESLLDSIFMDISRLLDPRSSCGKDNLSIDRLLPMATKKKYESVLGTNHLEVAELYRRLIRPWRNQRLSHNDVDTLTGQTGLPDVSFADIDELIAKINEVARYIVLCDTDVDRSFVPSVTPKAWTDRLFRVLREGVGKLPPEIRRPISK
jgi:hypothetical protein